MENDRSLFVDVDKVLSIFEKDFKDLSQNDWSLIKDFKTKITMSSSFAHKFSKRAKELSLIEGK